MEKIGYIAKDKLGLCDGLNSIEKLKYTKILFDYRSKIELRNDVVQPVCAGVIITKDGYVLTLCKTNKSAGKSLEKNSTLLYVGGHLDIEDSCKSNINTFIKGMRREVLEEINIDIGNNNIYNPIVTYTPTTETSAKHFGVIFPVVIEKCFDISFIDGECKFMKIEELSRIKNLESWSEIILKEILKLNSSEKQF